MATTLANAATTTGAKTAMSLQKGQKTFQAYGTTSSGSGAVSVKVEATIDGTSWDSLGTISLTLGTTVTSDSFTTNEAYVSHRANVLSISGTGAAVTVVTGA
jgi:hypothetical protein